MACSCFVTYASVLVVVACIPLVFMWQKSSVDVIQRNWFSTSSRKSSTAAEVQSCLSAFESIQLPLLFAIVNMADADVCPCVLSQSLSSVYCRTASKRFSFWLTSVLSQAAAGCRSTGLRQENLWDNESRFLTGHTPHFLSPSQYCQVSKH